MNRNRAPDGGSVSPAAHGVAERLLEAFFRQDRREERLLRGEVCDARDAANAATDGMADVFRAEFPGPPRRFAERAGRTFARALFLQDEIENWTALRSRRDALHPDLLLSDLSNSYAGDVETDSRWDDVRELLSRVCADVGIDAAYADRQTAFWRQHGQRDPDWRQTAVDAHRLKVEAMVPGCPPDEATALAGTFLSGVELHDRWGRADHIRDFVTVRDVVADYYQRIFDLRGGPPTPPDRVHR